MTPILIARRFPYVTKQLLCAPVGIIAHETYHQLYPETDRGREIAELAKQIRGLGYFDVIASEEPLPRTIKFFERDLPTLLPRAAEKFRFYAPLLQEWVDGKVTWRELRRHIAEGPSPEDYMDFD